MPLAFLDPYESSVKYFSFLTNVDLPDSKFPNLSSSKSGSEEYASRRLTHYDVDLRER